MQKGIITPDEYFEAITAINKACAHARAKPVDLALAISAGFLMLLPLIPWGIRHRKRRTKHKKILVEQIRLFNKYAARGVRMRWRRKPHSELVIERFPLDTAASFGGVAGAAAPARTAAGADVEGAKQ